MDFTSIPEYITYLLPAALLLSIGICLTLYTINGFTDFKLKKRVILIFIIIISLSSGIFLAAKDNYREVQEIAKNNIEKKYDTSNIKDIDYSTTREEATGLYTNWDTSSKEKLTFIFNEEGEPKLVTSTSETEYLKTIEKEISRN